MKVLSNGRTRRQLLLGLGVIAVLTILQSTADDLFVRDADSRARDLAGNAIDSVEQLVRLTHDIDQKRIVLARQVFMEELPEPKLEEQLATLDSDLEKASQAYARLIVFEGEAQAWQEIQLPLGRFQRWSAEEMELVRSHRNAEARARMSASVPEYIDVSEKLVELIGLNRAAGANALDQFDALRTSTVRVEWAVRSVGLLFLALFGWWGIRRVGRYEMQLTGYARELEHRNQDLDAFASRVAHDLKNALGPIVMSPTLLRRAAQSPNKISEVADRIERCSCRTTSILDALLVFSRAAQNAETDESGDLKSAVASVLEELASTTAKLEASIEVGEMPNVQLRCSTPLLHIVLANLFGNAVKYLDGRKERRVRISAREEASSCRIEIEDTGPGIPKDVQDKIFEPFFRVEGTRAPGTGIGLATVRRILDARGGRVAVESIEGKGSRFIVWLPIAASP